MKNDTNLTSELVVTQSKCKSRAQLLLSLTCYLRCSRLSPDDAPQVILKQTP